MLVRRVVRHRPGLAVVRVLAVWPGAINHPPARSARPVAPRVPHTDSPEALVGCLEEQVFE